jgi:hypothetical protein
MPRKVTRESTVYGAATPSLGGIADLAVRNALAQLAQTVRWLQLNAQGDDEKMEIVAGDGIQVTKPSEKLYKISLSELFDFGGVQGGGSGGGQPVTADVPRTQVVETIIIIKDSSGNNIMGIDPATGYPYLWNPNTGEWVSFINMIGLAMGLTDGQMMAWDAEKGEFVAVDAPEPLVTSFIDVVTNCAFDGTNFTQTKKNVQIIGEDSDGETTTVFTAVTECTP